MKYWAKLTYFCKVLTRVPNPQSLLNNIKEGREGKVGKEEEKAGGGEKREGRKEREGESTSRKELLRKGNTLVVSKMKEMKRQTRKTL